MAKGPDKAATPVVDAEGAAEVDETTAEVADEAAAAAVDGVSELTYEQARDELIGVVAQLEGGQLGLEESMRLWQRGEALAAHCSTWLDGAEAALTQGEAAQAD
jgi:exodeoxyribonuclease VII small subunit